VAETFGQGEEHSTAMWRTTGSILLLSWLTACGPASSTVTVQLIHEVDGKLLAFDDAGAFTNQADNHYDVTRLQYFLSDFTFSGSQRTATVDTPVYVDGRGPLTLPVGEVPAGSYERVSFVVGLLPEKNKTVALSNTLEHVEMAWPDAMGGGYHFLKFEGHFDQDKGFAIHLGGQAAGSLPRITLEQAITVPQNLGTELQLVFNLNEVFRTPTTFDLEQLNYTMGNDAAMATIANNLADAFALRGQTRNSP
jgi:hypothetical protein